MKRTLFFLLSLFCCGLIATAMPAKPGWKTFTQSDGTTIKVQAVGNAFNSAILTTDGVMVARGEDGDFYYKSSVTGLTAVRAHDAADRTPSETAFVEAQRHDLTMHPVQRPLVRDKGRLGGGGSNADADVPAMGHRRIPIILVEFKDKKFNNTREEIIDALLTGDKSVGQYFRDQSNGLYQPDFEVFGIYGLSQNRQYYGGHQGSNNDKALGAMVTEACQLAAANGVSFKPYDTNGDDYCDVVIVIYAGVGEAQASETHPEAVWPCHWYLSSASYYSQGGNGAFRPSNGDPLVDAFAVFNELYGDNDDGKTIDGIGTFAHEFGHCLGLPDFYDTGGGNHYGLGRWDIMCMGCYNNDGFTPSGYSAYEKVFMGWIDYITPQPGTYYTLPIWNQKNAATDKAICITSSLNQNEFFILENRRKQGWDRYAPGEGIMITHVTYNANRWWYNTPNNEDIQLMTLMNADNEWTYNDESTDLWPMGGNDAFTDSSTPAARLNMRSNGSITGSAGYLGKPVTEMEINSDGTASFWYMKNSASGPSVFASSNSLDFGGVKLNNSGSISFKVKGYSLTGDVTLTLNDNNGVFAIEPTVISASDAADGVYATVTFSPTELQDYNATLTLSSPGAQSVTVNLIGVGILETYTPEMLPAENAYIGLTKFRADWTDQTPEQNVLSYTLEVNPKPTFELFDIADFSEVPNAVEGGYLVDVSDNTSNYLPDGWSGTYYLTAYGGSMILINGGTIITPTYNFTGYDKVTVVVKAGTYYGSNSVMNISTSRGSEELALGGDYETYTIVLDCNENDAVTFANVSNYVRIKYIEIYAGDLTQAKLTAIEEGNETYRLITGITDKFYTVNGLLEAGTFHFKVKALYIDGTESDWSNYQEVTLYDNGHSYELGDVNHDSYIDVSDVTMLIAYVLGTSNECCPICGNVDQDANGTIDVSDVTLLISMVLNH